MTRLLVCTLTVLGCASSAAAQEPLSQEAFVARMSFYTREGGEWRSGNPDYKAGSGQPHSFGYQWRWTAGQQAARLTIFGLYDGGRRADFWETTVARHPIDPQVEMFQVGAGGALARGTMRWTTDDANEIRLTFVMPDGETWSFHETDTFQGPDRFESVSRRFRKGRWEVERRAIWTRVAAGSTTSSSQDTSLGAWQWITDAAAAQQDEADPPPGKWRFTVMAPGWHITTRPGVALYQPGAPARGRFALESETFIFPGESDAGFGLLAGGRGMEATPRYVAFLIRRDGQARVERREGGRVEVLRDWAALPAIAPGSPKQAVKNVLRLEVEETGSRFVVNGTVAAELPIGARDLEGVVGLRAGADLNLHVSTLDLTLRLAAVPEKQ